MLNKGTLDRLESINWDFDSRRIIDLESLNPFNNRKFHSYPATYIPELPFTLIEILSEVGDVVMDPFGGIGTTLTQAIIQNRIPISIDNNFVASKITSDFYTLLNPEVDAEQCKEYILQFISDYDEEKKYFPYMQGKRTEFKGWYEEKTLNELSYLILKRNQSAGLHGIDALFHICLSSLLTSVCSQNGGWAYIADNVKPKTEKIKYKPTIERFKTSLALLVRSIQTAKSNIDVNIFSKSNELKVKNSIHSDFLEVDLHKIKNLVDIVITSPPYPRMIDYVKSQRLSFYLEDREFTDELPQEIGARCRRNNKGTTDEYVENMKACNKKIFDCIKPGGYLCYILPDFSEESDRKKAIQEVIEDCISLGFSEVYRSDRSIPGTQRSNNIKWASLKKEIVIVMEKNNED